MEIINNGNLPQLRTDRSWLKVFLLSLITFGIYGIVVFCHISEEINLVASKYDNKKTMHYLWIILVFSWLTGGIAPLVWAHRISNRIGNEVKRRGSQYNFGASDFWLWGVLGSMIIIGPYVYLHHILTAMNIMNSDYNING